MYGMKKNIVLAGLLALSISLSANESNDASLSANESNRDIFIGLGIGKASFSTSYYDSSWGTEEDTEKETYFSLKAGKYIDNGRIMVSYTKYDTESYVDINALAIEYDYFIGNSSFQPYIGANIGYSMLSVDNGSDMDGLTYGVGIGALIPINKNFDVDIGLTYNLSNQNYSEIDSYGDNIEFDIESIMHMGIAINYNF